MGTAIPAIKIANHADPVEHWELVKRSLQIRDPQLLRQCVEKRSLLFLRPAWSSDGFPGFQSRSLKNGRQLAVQLASRNQIMAKPLLNYRGKEGAFFSSDHQKRKDHNGARFGRRSNRRCIHTN